MNILNFPEGKRPHHGRKSVVRGLLHPMKMTLKRDACPMKIRKFIAAWSFLLFLLNTLACSIPKPPQLVSISNPSVFRPRTPQEVNSLEQAMAAVITVCSQELGLPVVEPLYLQLYKDTDAYAAYASAYGRLSHQIANFSLAIAEENRIHINLERTRGRPWGSLVRILAHEYTHSVEHSLTGSLRRGAQWIREGFAEWVAVKVLHSLGWEDYAASLQRARQALVGEKDALPKLTDLDGPGDWVRLASQPKGSTMTYRRAFVAVDRLIEKKGVRGMEQYFSSEDFQGSFGLSWSDFETELKKGLVDAKPIGRVD